MMKTITLNLLVEEQLAQQAKARDPVKVAIAIGIGLITIAVLAGSWLTGVSMKRKSAADSLQTKLDTLNGKKIDDDGLDTKTMRGMSDQYVAISQSRWMVAPEIALVKDLIPPTIQVSSLRLALTSETPAVAPPSEDGEKRRAKPKPVNKIMLQIDGKAVCARAEIEVDSFIQNILTNEISRDHFTDVKLHSIGRTGDASGMPGAIFVIDCQIKGKETK